MVAVDGGSAFVGGVEMSSVDMCEHDWPGSGCPECFPKHTSGGVGFRFDVCMTPGDPQCEEPFDIDLAELEPRP